MNSRTAARQGVVARISNRTGEGIPVDMAFRPIIGVDGTTTSVATLNLADAQVPERRYVADFCAIIRSQNDVVKVVFGQSKLMSKDLKTALVLHLVPHAIRSILGAVRGVDSPTFFEIALRNGIPEVELSEIEAEPEQVVTLAASMAMIGVSGREACLDFYHASPFAVLQSHTTKKMLIDPVVRVTIQAAQMYAMLRRFEIIEKTFPSEILGDIK